MLKEVKNRLKEQKYDECITYNLSILKCLEYMERSCEKHSNEEEKQNILSNIKKSM